MKTREFNNFFKMTAKLKLMENWKRLMKKVMEFKDLKSMNTGLPARWYDFLCMLDDVCLIASKVVIMMMTMMTMILVVELVMIISLEMLMFQTQWNLWVCMSK